MKWISQWKKAVPEMCLISNLKFVSKIVLYSRTGVQGNTIQSNNLWCFLQNQILFVFFITWTNKMATANSYNPGENEWSWTVLITAGLSRQHKYKKIPRPRKIKFLKYHKWKQKIATWTATGTAFPGTTSQISEQPRYWTGPSKNRPHAGVG